MDVKSFRHCRLEVDDNRVVWLTLDVSDASANAISLELLEDFHDALDEAVALGETCGLVLRSAKHTGFCIGLDPRTLARLDDLEHARELLRRGQALTGRIVAWPQPTVAIMHGNCLGGGFEIALAATYRVAEDNASTLLGLPEIHLGLHPYLGGTVRLADVIGMTPALGLMVAGRTFGLAEAGRLGLVDVVVGSDGLRGAAEDLIARDPGETRPPAWRRALSVAPVRWTIEIVRILDDREAVVPESHPATTALRNLAWYHGSKSARRQVAAERRSTLELLEHPTTRNLRTNFLRSERLRREAREKAAEVAEVAEVTAPQRALIVGCGAIGREVAGLLAISGLEVALTDRSESALSAALQSVRTQLHRRLGFGPEYDAAQARVRTLGEVDSAGPFDVGIEAVDEDFATKSAVLIEIERQVAPEGLLATTTSTLSVEALGGALERLGRLVGLHFQIAIATVGIANLVEVVAARTSDPAAVAQGIALVNRVERIPLCVADSPGFLVSRLMLPYALAGASLYTKPQREVIDGAGRHIGMAAGPLELADWIGLDRCVLLADTLAERSGLEVPETVREQIVQGHIGRRSNHGFHDWRNDQRVTASLPPDHVSFHELGPALIEPLVIEAQRCRSEGVVADDDLLEIGAVIGVGFPAYAGGPLQYRRDRGALADRPALAGRERSSWWQRLLGFTAPSR